MEPKSTTKRRDFQCFSIPLSLDTPKSIPVERWLPPDIGGCQSISKLSRGLLIDAQASAGQAWLSATDPTPGISRRRPNFGPSGCRSVRPKAVAAASRTVLILWSTIAEVCAGAAADKLQEAPSSIALAQ